MGGQAAGIDDQRVRPQTRAAVLVRGRDRERKRAGRARRSRDEAAARDRDNPVGSVPAVMLNVYGPVPPLAVMVRL